jgi:cytochrome c oxidase subunit 2
MIFVLLAVATIAWSLTVLRWAFSRTRSRWRKRVIVMSWVAGAVAIASIADDARTMWGRFRATRSDVSIVITDMGDWWRVAYRSGGRGFITANEVHVPVRTLVAITWNGAPAGVWRARDFLPIAPGRFDFVASESGVDDVVLVRLHPRGWRHLRIVADPAPAFQHWFADQLQPAPRGPDGALFVDAGCAYCHVVRGVAESPSTIAPDLTHFASRRTIAAIDLPNAPGFLSGWIVNSRALKPASEMPRNAIDAGALRRLVAYLETLR